MMRKALSYALCIVFAGSLASCIKNDIPYPLVEAYITGIETECQCDENGNSGGSATINKSARTVELYVDDQVSLKNVRISKLTFTDEAVLSILNPERCANYARFPRTNFTSAAGCDTRLDCTSPNVLRLTTYQTYDWTLTVHQVIKRSIVLDGQIGDPVIDEVNHNVVIYVDETQPLSAIHVSEFKLGGQHGTVTPDPTETDSYDFSKTASFYVKMAYEETSTEWRVFVYPKAAGQGGATATVFPMSTRATVSGTMRGGQTLGIEYKKQGAQAWTALDASSITTQGTRFTATLRGLSPSTAYVCRVLTGGTAGGEQTFTTAPAPQLTDASFDNWHKVGRMWNPWMQGGTSFWDTGNQGATTVGESNSVPTDETCNGKGQAAYLQSKYIVIKFAAGNIFTGEYAETDGTNGILNFGRPFTGFPTKLRINYKYKTSTINRSADADYEYLKGRPDSCQIYIALADWDKPYEIRTRPSTRHLFDPKDPGVIAYAQITVGEDVPQWKQQDLELDYYASAAGRTPKYILVVCSSSKYGDFFTGGEGSQLWVDNFELIYD